MDVVLFPGGHFMQSKNHSKIMQGQNDECYLKKRVLSHMLQERVTFAFDGVVAQIINSWQAPSVSPPASIFFLFTSLFPSPLSLPHPFVSACPMNQSGWQCAAVREPVRVITHVELGQDLDGQS